MQPAGEETKTSTDAKPPEEEKKAEPPPPNKPVETKPQSSAKPPPIQKPSPSEDGKNDDSNDELHNTQILNKNYDEVVELDESCAQSFATPRNFSAAASRKTSIVGAKTEGETKKNDPLNRSYDETVELSHAAESIDSRVASPGNDQHIRIDTKNTEKYKDNSNNNNNNNISPNSHSNSRQNLGGTGGSIGANNTMLSETKTSTEEGYNESLQNTANSEFGSTTFSQPPNIFNESGNMNNNNNNNTTGGRSTKSGKSGGGGSMGDNESNDDINDSGDDDDDKSISLPHASSSKGYNAADYAHLNVNKEVRELFQYINQYKPPDLTLDVKMVCFVPDYLPSIGQIDTFIKVPRPDGKPDGLGLTQLDEPATVESDRTVLELQLRAISKKKNNDPITIRSIENAEKNPERIQQWIDSVMDIHKSKPSPQVHYSKPMPEMETLMEQWSAEFEEGLKSIEFPTSEIDLSLNDFSRLVCAIMDIPVYDKNNKNNSVVEALHCLFSLYESYNEIPNFACKNPSNISE